MATDLEKLVVQLSADIRKFDREVAKINGIANRQFRAVENRARQMNKNLDAIFSRSVNGLMAPLAGIGAALSVQEVARYADAWTVAGNKLAAAGQVAGMQARSLEDLNKIANDTRSGISETADLYAKLMRSTKGVAQSELEVAKATEIVNKAFKAGGAAASEQAAGILQLGQGLGSGMLQGDELRSVRENAPMLAQAIADYFKVSIAGLKDLGAEGKLTSDKVFKAILAAQPQIEAAFNKTNSTISDGLTKVNNAMTQYVGETDKGLDASQRLIAGLNALADNFDNTADIVLKLAAIIAGALVGRSIVSMVRGLGLATSATLSLISALRTASSLSGLATAFGGIGAAAGPLGMIIGGTVVGALALFSSSSAQASDGAQAYASALEEVREAAEKVPDAVNSASKAIDEKSRNSNKEGLRLAKEDLEGATQAAIELFEHLERSANTQAVSPQQLAELDSIREAFIKGTASAEDTRQALFKLANANPDFQAVANSFDPILLKITEILQSIGVLDIRLSKIGGVSDGAKNAYIQYQNSRSVSDQAMRAGQAYVKEAQRRNTLTKDQLALENEIAAIRKKSAEDGFILTDQQIKAQAQANLAADARRSAEGKKPRKERKTPEQDFSEDLQSIADRTAALIAETEAQRQINPLIDDYGYAIEKARVTQELLNAAQKAGVAITPQLRSEIAATAEQFALATQEAGKLAQAQDDIRSSLEDWRSVGKDATGGVLNDLIAGKSVAEAFAGALNKVLDKLLEMSLNGIFGQSGGSNWFASLFGSIVGRKNGGVVYADTGGLLRGAGGPRSDSIPAMLSNGEYVVNAAATKQFRPILEAINSGRGLRLNDGGMASLKAPTMPILKAAGTKSNDVGSTKIDVGVSVDQNGNLQAYVKNIAQTTTQNGIKSYDKSGAARLRRDSREANRRGLV